MVISELCSDTGTTIVGYGKKSVVSLLDNCGHKVEKDAITAASVQQSHARPLALSRLAWNHYRR